MKQRKMKSAKEFDELFDSGESISQYLDFENASVSEGLKALKRVNVDFTQRAVYELDDEAQYEGISRQALIKILVDEGLMQRKERRLRIAREEAALA